MPKLVYGNYYVHRDFLRTLPQELRGEVERAAAFMKDTPWNLAKVSEDGGRVTLSRYRNFDEDPHPSLVSWHTIDVARGTVRSGRNRGDNPMILHRKETFVDQSHPKYQEFARLTLEEERAGLYDAAPLNKIGRRKFWAQLLDDLQVSIVNHRVVKAHRCPRGRQETLPGFDAQGRAPMDTLATSAPTAMHRKGPSKTVRDLFEQGLLRGRVFDWGCGRGADVDFLASKGLTVVGWDPAHAPRNHPAKCDGASFDWVICSFVLNTIADPQEREAIVKEIHEFLAPGSKAVFVVRPSKEIDRLRSASWRKWRDGWLTQRNTFQKGFEPSDLMDLLRSHGFAGDAWSSNPVAVLATKLGAMT